jgi:hypothetical protein
MMSATAEVEPKIKSKKRKHQDVDDDDPQVEMPKSKKEKLDIVSEVEIAPQSLNGKKQSTKLKKHIPAKIQAANKKRKRIVPPQKPQTPQAILTTSGYFMEQDIPTVRLARKNAHKLKQQKKRR